MSLFGHTFKKSSKKARETDKAVATAMAERGIKKDTWSPRRIMSAFTKRKDSVSEKVSSGENRGKGKEKQVEATNEMDVEHNIPQQVPSDDEDDLPLPRRPWHPEFQAKPPPSCNCLKLKWNHEFSYKEIQKMRWFIDRMVRKVAQPEDWLGEETQSTAEREIQVWSIMNPLMQLKYYSMSFQFIE